MVSPNAQQAAPHDKPYFPISMRLLRVVSILIQKYHCLLVTECEIFLSLIVKFLDPDKPLWQCSLALEVIHKMTVQPELLASFCRCYDLKDHATNIFQDIIISLGAFVQSSLLLSCTLKSSPLKIFHFNFRSECRTITDTSYDRRTADWAWSITTSRFSVSRGVAAIGCNIPDRPIKVHIVS